MTYLALPSMETMDMTLSPPKEPVLVAQPPLLLPRHNKIQELVPRQSKVQEQFRYSRVQRSLPVVLLPDDDMAALYEEQVRMASPLARVSRDRGSSVITEPLVRRGLGKIILHSERPQERRVSNVSRPRTSSSTSRRSTPQFECHICFEKLDAEQTQLCETCEGSYCKNCMKWYIEYKIREGEVSKKKMVCPAPQCPHPLSEQLVKSYVSPELQEKYYQYLNNQRPGVRFCPQPGCCALIEEPLNSTKRRVHCTACGHDSCMRCKGDYHKLRTCRRVDRRYGKWKKNNNVRACPNCHTDIEKQGGCCHMKCFQCDQEFCWSCLRSWQNHDETLCVPLAFLRSKSSKYGPWQPVRVLTKSVIVGAAAVVVVTGAGVAVVVVPSVLLFQWAKTSWRTRRYLMRDTEAFMIE